MIVTHLYNSHLVNIRSTTYVVKGRTYTVDHADKPVERSVVCVISLQIVP